MKDKVHKHWSNFTTPTQRKCEVKNNSGTSSSTHKEFSILVCYINKKRSGTWKVDNFNASWLWSICETMTSCLWHLHEGQRCHTHQLRHLITGGTSDEQFWLWWHKYSPEILYSVRENVSKKPRWGLQQDCSTVQLKLMVYKSRLHLRNLSQAYCKVFLGRDSCISAEIMGVWQWEGQ